MKLINKLKRKCNKTININSNNIINGGNISVSSCNGKNKITINGKTYDNLPSGNISIRNNSIYINGKKFDASDSNLKENSCQTVNISIYGDCENIECNGSVSVYGNVKGKINCSGNGNVEGDVESNINCGGSCLVEGNCKGNINANGSVKVGGR